MNGSWSFREFLTFVQPLTQYSLKAKDLNTGIVLGDANPLGGEGQKDKKLLDESSSTSSLGELNALLKKKPSKYSKIGTISNAGGALSKASKSTAAMSFVGAIDGNKAQMSTI